MNLTARFLVVCLLLSLSGAARAEEDAAKREQATRLFKEGTTSYNLGEFKTATERFREAYKIYPDSAFLYNIAQAYRMLGDPTQALHFYRTYLRTAPQVPARTRQQIEARMAEAEKLIAEGRKNAEAQPTGTTPPAMLPRADGSAGEAQPAAATATPAPPATSPTPEPAATAATAAVAPSSGAVTTVSLSQPPAGSDVHAELVSSAPPPAAAEAPVYKRWWFWGAAGAVVAGGVLALALSGGKSDGAERSTLGSYGPGVTK